MFETKMTKLFGIKYPIQCGSMQWLSRAELVSAVANAGGLACLTAATFEDGKELSEEIKKTRDLTDRPFGVNVSLLPRLSSSDIEEFIDTVLDSGVKILETAGRNPQPYRKRIMNGGAIHIHKCARVQDTISASRLGVDVVSIVGTECAGHPGMESVTSMVLIPKVAEVVKVPLIAGGGICDGRSLVAALALGADGIVMGTRFINTKECFVHQNLKQRFLEASEKDTVLVMESIKNPGRVLRNAWAEKVLDMERAGSTLEELSPVISGKVTLKGWLDGNFEKGLFYCGQVVGRIHDIPSVPELMKRIIDEALEIRERLNQIINGS